MADKGKGVTTSNGSKRKIRTSKQSNLLRQEQPIHDDCCFRDEDNKVRYNGCFARRKLIVEKFVELVALLDVGLEVHLELV